MATDYTGDPTAAEAPSSAPGPGVAPILRIPDPGDAFSITALDQPLKAVADYIAWLTIHGTSAAFGDGSDGACVFDGAATILGMAPVANVYTMVRDIFPSSMSVGNGVTVRTAGFRVFCKGTLTTTGTGKLSANGNDANIGTPGAAGTNGTILGGAVGGTAGTAGGGGGNGGSTTGSFGGNGGAGGNGGGGGGAAGAAGTATAPGATLGTPRSYSPSHLGFLVGLSTTTPTLTGIRGGAGGGGGGNDSGGLGVAGGGGGGGGVLCVAASQLVLAAASSLTAAGGAGGNAVVGGNNGGGGGGGGGVLIVVYTKKNAVTFSAATNCPGGALGTKVNSGTNGVAGSNGSVYEIAL